MGLVVSAMFAPFINSWAILLIVIAVCILVVVYIMHKFVKPLLETDSLKSNANGMIGKSAMVIEDISDTTGRIKLYGDEWNAYTVDGSLVSKGQKVEIEKIDGNKVQVKKIEV